MNITGEKMGCPMFIDYVRECVDDIENLPGETITFCDSDNYTNCPFYLKSQNKSSTCKNISNCHFFNNFSMESFQDFINITKNYCLSLKHVECVRYTLRESGEKVPDNLSPDGNIIDKIP